MIRGAGRQEALKMRYQKLFPLAAVLALAAGCATSSHVIVGKVRPPTTADQVKLYTQPPAKYEEIALLNANSRRSFALTDQGKTDKVIERLKAEAASLGANGVLLQGIGERHSGSVGIGAGSSSFSGSSAGGIGFGLSGATTDKTANGLAIYVPQP
jgi:uncharacterized lipoprotein YajG